MQKKSTCLESSSMELECFSKHDDSAMTNVSQGDE